jgi:hypothetical protein
MGGDPVYRVVQALRRDTVLSEPDVRDVMSHYLRLRQRAASSTTSPASMPSLGRYASPGRSRPTDDSGVRAA